MTWLHLSAAKPSPATAAASAASVSCGAGLRGAGRRGEGERWVVGEVVGAEVAAAVDVDGGGRLEFALTTLSPACVAARRRS